jgi:hypothetical protein
MEVKRCKTKLKVTSYELRVIKSKKQLNIKTNNNSDHSDCS